MSKIRIANLIIQPVLIIDDGEELSPGPNLEPAQISPSQFEDYLLKLKEFVEGLNTPSAELDE